MAVSAVALTLRPVNIAFLPAALAAFLLLSETLPRQRIRLCLALCFMMAAGYFLTPAVHMLRHDGVTATSPLARGLLQKTLFRQWPDDAAADACEGKRIAVDTRDADAFVADAPSDIQPYLLLLYSSYLRFRVIIPELMAVHHWQSMGQADPVLRCYALARIRSDPLYFVEDTLRQLYRLLSNYTFVTSEQHTRIAYFLAAHPPVLPLPVNRRDVDYQLRARAAAELGLDRNIFAGDDAPLAAPQARPWLPALALRLLQWTAALLLAAVLTALPWQMRLTASDRNIRLLSVIAVLFYSELFITAAVELAQPRYFFPLWPLVALALMLFIVRWLEQKRRHTG